MYHNFGFLYFITVPLPILLLFLRSNITQVLFLSWKDFSHRLERDGTFSKSLIGFGVVVFKGLFCLPEAREESWAIEYPCFSTVRNQPQTNSWGKSCFVHQVKFNFNMTDIKCGKIIISLPLKLWLVCLSYFLLLGGQHWLSKSAQKDSSHKSHLNIPEIGALSPAKEKGDRSYISQRCDGSKTWAISN